MKKNFSLGLATVATITFSACGSTKQDVKNVTNDKVQQLKLMDTFTSECENIPLDGLKLAARKVQFAISGHIEKTTTYYATDDCKEAVLEISTTGEYANVDTVAENSDIGRIDIKFTHTEITPRNEDVKNMMNQVKYCGISEWGMDAKDVSNSADDVNCPGTQELGKVSYDLISTRNGELHLGLAIPVVQDKSSPEKRPKALDSKVLGRK